MLRYGSGDFVARVVGVLMIAILARSVSASELGLFSIIAAMSGPFALAIGFGGEGTFTRFYFDTSDPAQRKIVATSWTAWLILAGGASVVVVWLFSGPLAVLLSGASEHGTALTIGLAAMPIVIVALVLSQLLRIEERFRPFIALNVGGALLYLALGAVMLLVFDQGIVGVLTGGLAAAAIVLPLRLWLVRHNFGMRVSSATLGPMIRYGSWAALANLGVVTLAFADRLVVARLLGLETLGYYGIAGTLQSVLGFLAIAVGQAWLPHVLRMWQERPSEVPSFVARAATLLLLAFASVAAALIVFADQIIVLLAGSKFLAASIAVPGLAVATVAHGLTSITGLGLLVTKATNKLAIMSGVAAVAGIALSIALTPTLGIIGASWGVAAAYALLATLYNIASQRAWPIPYERGRIAGLIALLLAFAVVVPRLEIESFAVDLVIRSALLVGFVTAGCAVAKVRLSQLLAVLPGRS